MARMGDNLMAEPLSKLQPPGGTNEADERVHPPQVAGAGSPKREWVIVDYNAATMPGTEIFLPGLWKRMHDDGTFNMFFHEGAEMSFCQFGALLATPVDKVQLVIGHDENGTAVEHAGMLLLTHILYNDVVKRAVGNFLFFKEYWNRHDTQELGQAVLDHWFGVMDFDVIAGTTPRGNRAAIQFIKRLGFQIIGDIPDFTQFDGKRCASATSFMTRKMWQDRKGA
jgi:RimJ/RimL family protein N-acetyltransferase